MKDPAIAPEDRPGALAEMDEAGVDIEVLYSDHDRQLILVVDDIVRGRKVSDEWNREIQPWVDPFARGGLTTACRGRYFAPPCTPSIGQGGGRPCKAQ